MQSLTVATFIPIALLTHEVVAERLDWILHGIQQAILADQNDLNPWSMVFDGLELVLRISETVTENCMEINYKKLWNGRRMSGQVGNV